MTVSLRPWQEQDVAAVARYANNPRLAAYLRDPFPVPYTAEDALWFVQHSIRHAEGRNTCLAIVADEEVVGSVALSLHTDIRPVSAEIGYWIGEPHWNQGIMTKAVSLICEMAFANPRVMRIYAEVFPENTASRRVLEKSGFHLVGIREHCVLKNGDYLPCCTYERLRHSDKKVQPMG